MAVCLRELPQEMNLEVLEQVDERLQEVQRERELQHERKQDALKRIFIALALVITFIFLLASSLFNTRSSAPTGPIELEPWQQQVCQIHHQLSSLDPAGATEPIHKLLNIDAKSAPFFPLSASAHPNSGSYQAIHKAIHDSLANMCRSDVLHDVLNHRTVNFVRCKSDQWMHILHQAANALLDDETRIMYAKNFLPALEGSRGQKEMALKRLCRSG